MTCEDFFDDLARQEREQAELEITPPEEVPEVDSVPAAEDDNFVPVPPGPEWAPGDYPVDQPEAVFPQYA